MKSDFKNKFFRMDGSGNTFILYVNFDGTYQSEVDKVSVVKQICEEQLNFNSDGFIFIEKSDNSGSDFKWDFYNSDGSKAEFCGNASRCVSLFYYWMIEKKEEIVFQSVLGNVRTKVIDPDGTIEVEMPKINLIDANKRLKINNKEIRCALINSGVPHLVLETEPNQKLADNIRNLAEFKKTGINITFVDCVSDKEAVAVTNERGLNDFTLACGTGAVAAAYYLKLKETGEKEILVEMPGGVLIVRFENNQVKLLGPANFHFKFEFINFNKAEI